MTYNLNKSIL